MESIIFTKTYPQPPVNKAEIFRYMRCGDSNGEFDELLEACLSELLPQLSYKVCWRVSDISDEVVKTSSRVLSRALQGCDKLVLFAATIGLAPDRLIAKYGRLSPSKALCMQAIGAERIESLCDAFCDEIAADYAEKGYHARRRFSPGYGDFPLDVQKAIFQNLDCPRKIGLSLNDSLLMSPSKSVTALIGLSSESTCIQAEGDTLEPNHKNCAACNKTDCLFREA